MLGKSNTGSNAQLNLVFAPLAPRKMVKLKPRIEAQNDKGVHLAQGLDQLPTVTIYDVVGLRAVVVFAVYVVSWQLAFALSRPRSLQGNSRHLLFFLIKS